jgi:hypothetical protein
MNRHVVPPAPQLPALWMWKGAGKSVRLRQNGRPRVAHHSGAAAARLVLLGECGRCTDPLYLAEPGLVAPESHRAAKADRKADPYGPVTGESAFIRFARAENHRPGLICTANSIW